MFFKPESSSSRPEFNFDDFLSFRGEDTRKNFTDHLYTALVQAGIHTFRDDNELPRGKEISPQLIEAIRESWISVVIFSKGYAFSRWCLDELAEILNCKHTSIHQIVLPIFYDIDPSDVRKQKGSFAEAFERHDGCFKEKIEKVKGWREALEEVGNLSGWNLKDVANGHESKFIQKIVEDVLNKLDHKYLNVAKYTVGIEPRVDDVINLLSIGSNDVWIVGIHGMAGIGKTTIAKAVFNRLCYGFEGSCFLFNVKEMSKGSSGLVQLQKQLLCDILKSNVWKISHVDSGINLIKERLCCKRVLIVLDDADQLKQLDALVGERSWFGHGSRIIITTRNEHLLTQYEVDKKFEVKVFNQTESIQLFSWHAFRGPHPAEEFLELATGVVDYCKGLPLALEVLGSSLFKRSKPEWKSIIKKLNKIPSNEIQEKLRTSFDSLDDHVLKDAFLDIACFFVGWDKEYVMEILDGRGFHAVIGIKILVERSLVTINHCNQLDMHDLVRDMGREIVREKSLGNPGKRSRIWFQEDALDVLKKQMGTEAVEGLTLDVPAEAATSVGTRSFTEMRFLKLLKISGVHLTGSFEHLSKELLWLCWHKCPLKLFPSNFQLYNLVILDMQHSNIKELWKETKVLRELKILNLSYSKSLVKTPNFHSSCLKKLILVGCISLVELDQSIGNFQNLVCLNLEGCRRLKILPESMGDLKSLETLNLISCSQLEKLPEHLGDMTSLIELLADKTAVKQLPSSIGNLKNLSKISLSGYKEHFNQIIPSASWLSLLSLWLSPRSSNSKALLPASFSCLSSLRELNLSYCGSLSEGVNSTDFGCLSSLQCLNLSGNKFPNLPTGIGCLPKLEALLVNECTNLLSISDLPLSLGELAAHDCTSLETLSIQSDKQPSVSVGGCQNLIKIEGMEGMVNSWIIDMEECYNLSTNFKKSIVQELCKGENYDINLVGSDIPEWFSRCGEGSSISFQVPIALSELQALVFWVVLVGSHRRRFRYPGAVAFIKNKSKGILLFTKSTFIAFNTSYNSHSWVSHMTLKAGLFPCAMLDGGDELELRVRINTEDIKVVKCAIHLVIENSDASWKGCLVRELQQLQISAASRDYYVGKHA